MTIDVFNPSPRHPENTQAPLRPRAASPAAKAAAGSEYLEILWLACSIAVVAGVLPLVMFLR